MMLCDRRCYWKKVATVFGSTGVPDRPAFVLDFIEEVNLASERIS